jgi:hypothetical protein
MANYYYADSARQIKGPVPFEQLRTLLREGALTASSLVAEVGASDWVKLSEVLTDLAPPPGQNEPPAPPGSPYATPGTATPPFYFPATGLDRRIPNYLVQSILVTIFCCLPFGIVAIVYASKVDTLQLTGDFQGAQSASNSAKTWCLISFIIGIIIVALLVMTGFFA